ncbi:MAG: DNA-binding protein [Verrucomicrobia bacterium]|nr:MAG: DNA-binding protein [Verrucomicrobiota bacterium]
MAVDQPAIHLVRGQRVMLDSDLAKIYQVSTKRLNQQLRRNRSRFPVDFAFRLTVEELTNLRLQTATSKKHGGLRYLPWVFTEHGAIMLASVLNSDIAVQASVRVVRAFVRLREMVNRLRICSNSFVNS